MYAKHTSIYIYIIISSSYNNFIQKRNASLQHICIIFYIGPNARPHCIPKLHLPKT